MTENSVDWSDQYASRLWIYLTWKLTFGAWSSFYCSFQRVVQSPLDQLNDSSLLSGPFNPQHENHQPIQPQQTFRKPRTFKRLPSHPSPIDRPFPFEFSSEIEGWEEVGLGEGDGFEEWVGEEELDEKEGV